METDDVNHALTLPFSAADNLQRSLKKQGVNYRIVRKATCI